MNSKKIYPSFLQKLNKKEEISGLKEDNNDFDLKKPRKYRTIISFNDNSQRENFLKVHEDLNILKKFDFISSINALLTENEILSLQNEKDIKIIEEDQKLFLSILEVNEIIGLNNYRNSVFQFTGSNINVGIIDNGINQNVDSISRTIKKQYLISKTIEEKKSKSKLKRATHGTLMASIIGNQYIDYNDNIIGIAPDVKIIDFFISNKSEKYYFSDILETFDLIIKESIEIDILLISFTTLNPSDGNDILSLACNALVDKGIIIVCPAGNSGPENYTIGSPSAAEKVITVGALTKDGIISSFSGRGPTLDEREKPEIYLPGSEINIPLSNKNRIDMSGTSISAAICVGIIAIIIDFNKSLSSKEVLEIIKKSSFLVNSGKGKNKYQSPSIVRIFKELKHYQEETLSYQYLLRRSLKFSIEFFITFLIIFYIVYVIDISRFFL